MRSGLRGVCSAPLCEFAVPVTTLAGVRRAPLTYLPMYVSPSMDEPPGFHRADIERTSAMRKEQEVNTDARKEAQSCVKAQTAEL